MPSDENDELFVAQPRSNCSRYSITTANPVKKHQKRCLERFVLTDTGAHSVGRTVKTETIGGPVMIPYSSLVLLPVEIWN